jgi:hypothetical protein
MQDASSQKIQRLLNDPKIYAVLEGIGNRFDLNIDQIGEIDAEIQRVILGMSKPADFTKNIAAALEIDEMKAKTITEATNTEVMGYIKEALRADDISALEKAGGFEIERPSESVMAKKPMNLLEDTAVEEKHDIMAGIEDPEPVVMRPAGAAPRKEPLVDQLLRGTTAVPEKKVMREEKQGDDPYREPIK